MSRFSAPIAEQIWDMKYRLKDADGNSVIESTSVRFEIVSGKGTLAQTEVVATEGEAEVQGGVSFLPVGQVSAEG